MLKFWNAPLSYSRIFEMPHFSYLILKMGKMGHFKIFDHRKFRNFSTWSKCYHMTKSSFTCFLGHFILPPVWPRESKLWLGFIFCYPLVKSRGQPTSRAFPRFWRVHVSILGRSIWCVRTVHFHAKSRVNLLFWKSGLIFREITQYILDLKMRVKLGTIKSKYKFCIYNGIGKNCR